MKRMIKDVLYGLLVVVAVTVLEFIVTLPFGEPVEFGTADYLHFINRELLLTALPAALVTFAFSRLLKTGSRSDAMRRSVTWTVIIFLNYAIIGIGNDNFRDIFSTIGIYALLACAFAGPLLHARFKHLK